LLRLLAHGLWSQHLHISGTSLAYGTLAALNTRIERE
jgi:hypothetical protein